MKMKYVKPAMCIELYSLTESIAAACEVHGRNNDFGKNTFANGNTCEWIHYDFDVAVFTDANTNCVIMDEDYYMGCYNNPVGEPQLFGS